jgi:hypothetical protein
MWNSKASRAGDACSLLLVANIVDSQELPAGELDDEVRTTHAAVPETEHGAWPIPAHPVCRGQSHQSQLTLRQLEKLGYTAECAEDGARPTPCGRPGTTACC